MREGSLEAPTRHHIGWDHPDFLSEAKIDEELRRVFDICHGCRRCFNLCDSFPRLFDLFDASPTGEIDGIKSEDFAPVVEACTVCDMCYMTKCPYVPPHEWNLDFPHLMLRARMAEAKKHGGDFVARELGKMDRNGRLAALASPLVNAASSRKRKGVRTLVEKVSGIDRDAELPRFHTKTFVMADRGDPVRPNEAAPAFGKRKAVLFATCFVNYNKPSTGMAARAVLNHLGVETQVFYPGCCGMPQLEQAQLDQVSAKALKISAAFRPFIDQGYDVITLTASCGLMFKSEWKLIAPKDENVDLLSRATFDIDQYVVDIARKEGLPPGLAPLDGGVSVHLACHARAQNIGPKAAELLKLIPQAEIDVIERCSGHGGTFGVLKKTRPLANKVGKPVFRAALKANKKHIVSDCPLAAKHIVQGMNELAAGSGDAVTAKSGEHPIEVFARAYGLLP